MQSEAPLTLIFSPLQYVSSVPARIAAGARDLSRRNVSTAQTRPQNSKAFFAHQHPCGLKSALRRSRGDRAKHVPGGTPVPLAYLVFRVPFSGWWELMIR